MRTLTLFLLCITTFLFANDEPITLSSKLEKVTVFKNGAQITRTATGQVPQGKQVLKFTGLPVSFVEKSLQVKAKGEFTVLAIQHKIHLDTQQVDLDLISRLKGSNDSLSATIEEWELQLQVLVEEEALIINNNEKNGKDKSRLAIEELKEMAAFYRSKLKEIRLEKLRFQRKIKAFQQKIYVQKQAIRDQQNQQTTLKNKEILVTTLAKIATTGKFELSYLVNNAGWIPTYDLRVKDVQNPIDLLYKAQVFQQSGEDWENVKLTLSNADPRLSGEKPTLNKWNLGFYQPIIRPTTTTTTNYRQMGMTYNLDGSRTLVGQILDAAANESLIGANVLVVGTNNGTVTDFDGYFELNIPKGHSVLEISYTGYSTQRVDIKNTNSFAFGLESGAMLDEVVVTGYAGSRNKLRRQSKKEKATTQPVEVSTFQKTTSVEFQIKERYSIKQDGEKYMVTIQQFDIPAYYEYYCAPKLEEAVFLTAMINDWEAYNLLSGTTSLYFEGTFLGNAQLDVESLQDTISISLGRDKNILVKRNLRKDYAKKQLIGNKKMETKAIEIEIRNKKKQPINLVIEDHFPVAVTNEIEVKIGQYKGANLEESTKILKWELKIEPEKTRKIGFGYSVKYPKRSRVVLD